MHVESEDLSGQGAVYHLSDLVCRVDYELHLRENIEEIPVIGDVEEVATRHQITGKIEGAPEDMAVCYYNPTHLTLQIEDGRRLDFVLKNRAGEIAESGRSGLYTTTLTAREQSVKG